MGLRQTHHKPKSFRPSPRVRQIFSVAIRAKQVGGDCIFLSNLLIQRGGIPLDKVSVAVTSDAGREKGGRLGRHATPAQMKLNRFSATAALQPAAALNGEGERERVSFYRLARRKETRMLTWQRETERSRTRLTPSQPASQLGRCVKPMSNAERQGSATATALGNMTWRDLPSCQQPTLASGFN
ncbi:hypothetical protein ACLOJK_009221 [Asimina triloba]